MELDNDQVQEVFDERLWAAIEASSSTSYGRIEKAARAATRRVVGESAFQRWAQSDRVRFGFEGNPEEDSDQRRSESKRHYDRLGRQQSNGRVFPDMTEAKEARVIRELDALDAPSSDRQRSGPPLD